jgi:hypothetical protein
LASFWAWYPHSSLSERTGISFFGGYTARCAFSLLWFIPFLSLAVKESVGFSQFNSTRMTVSPGLITQPVVPRSASPKSIELGNTPDEVQLVMGQADKIINLGARVIHVYKDMKIIYVDGKVSDVQLS